MSGTINKVSGTISQTDCSLVNEMYAWDANGNLAAQSKEGRYAESFQYDALNRLTQGALTQVNGVTTTRPPCGKSTTRWATFARGCSKANSPAWATADAQAAGCRPRTAAAAPERWARIR